jgi:glycosyltransferase involved in cell wall biosynthesis
MPSLWDEPFGIVGLEALAAGVPVVASDVGGIPSWLEPGDCGELVGRGKVGDLADALGRILADTSLRDRCRAAGPLRAAEFSLDRHVTQLEAVFDASARPR